MRIIQTQILPRRRDSLSKGESVIRLHAIGLSYTHDGDFLIDRPNGSGDNLLLIFKTPAFVVVNGVKQSVPADSAIMYSLGSPQLYGAVNDSYENHWVHFECDEKDIFFDRIKNAFDVPRSVSSLIAAENVLEMLTVENVSHEEHNTAEDLLLRLLILKIFGESSVSRTVRTVHSEALRKLRAEVYSKPSFGYTTENMAAKLNLSTSYFQMIYKKEFGISCYDDVIMARIAAAEHYLRNTEMTIKEISHLCGYENDVHFSRQYKLRRGMTATEYRKMVNK